jgi:antitoxin component HigA of HigAB toxin-antitoxin module
MEIKAIRTEADYLAALQEVSAFTTVRSKPQQNQLVSVGWYLSFVVAGLQGA